MFRADAHSHFSYRGLASQDPMSIPMRGVTCHVLIVHRHTHEYCHCAKTRVIPHVRSLPTHRLINLVERASFFLSQNRLVG